jgi:hypothetical protein
MTYFFKFIISVMGGHCGHLAQMPRNLVLPVFRCYVNITEFHLKYLNITRVNRDLEDNFVILI